jgi:hypothetical protein
MLLKAYTPIQFSDYLLCASSFHTNHIDNFYNTEDEDLANFSSDPEFNLAIANQFSTRNCSGTTTATIVQNILFLLVDSKHLLEAS